MSRKQFLYKEYVFLPVGGWNIETQIQQPSLQRQCYECFKSLSRTLQDLTKQKKNMIQKYYYQTIQFQQRVMHAKCLWLYLAIFFFSLSNVG